MNKTKKGFLTASSIISIVASGLAILMALILFLAGAMTTEQTIKDSYKDSGEYVYYEQADGSYYFVEIDDDTLQEIRITEEEIELITKVTTAVLYFAGVVSLAFAIARLILSIKTLVNNNREHYSLGTTIALLVLSILSGGLLEAAFLIAAICVKNKPITETNKT